MRTLAILAATAIVSIAAALPAGVLNIVNGGSEIGRHLVSHPHIDKVAFTGSPPAGGPGANGASGGGGAPPSRRAHNSSGRRYRL